MGKILDTKLPVDNLIACFNESTKDCIKVLDADATILSFNPEGYKIMEIDDPNTVIGKDWLQFWQGDMKQLAKDAFAKAIDGELGYFEGYCPSQKGTPKWWEITIVPLKNDLKEVEWILSMSRDVTELHDLRKVVAQVQSDKSVASVDQ